MTILTFSTIISDGYHILILKDTITQNHYSQTWYRDLSIRAIGIFQTHLDQVRNLVDRG
jgi:hypothetical protein